MGKWYAVFVGDKENEAWALVDPDENQHDEYWYDFRHLAEHAAEILNRHVPGEEYITVCFSTKVSPDLRRYLSILEDGTVELTPASVVALAQQTDNHVFGVAQVGCPEWAEEAGADPSLWRD